MSSATVNRYLSTSGIAFTKAPKMVVSKTGNRYYYNPLSTVTNGQNRFVSQYRDHNDSKEMELLLAACHVKTVLGWELHHLVAHSNGGSCNVENLCILPKGLNYAIGPNDWSLDQINEFVSNLPDFARKAYGIPKDFQALPLSEGVKNAPKWATATLVKAFERRSFYG